MALLFEVTTVTPRSLGGGPASHVADHLNARSQDFGPAFETFDLTLSYNQWRPGSAASNSCNWLVTKNARRLARKRKLIEIKWIAQHSYAKQLDNVFRPQMTVDIFDRCFDDLIDAIRFGLDALKPSDAFDAPMFLAWLLAIRREKRIDGSAFQALLDAGSQARTNRTNELDPWDRLDIDWSKLYPKARSLLDDPDDWNTGYEFAPHGNDCGADIWADWKAFAKLTPEQAGHVMGLPPISPDLPDYLWTEWVHLYLALAFGHVKTSGSCPPDLNHDTRAIITAELERNLTRTWTETETWAKRLQRYQAILSKLAA